jgi:hypothetical protein
MHFFAALLRSSSALWVGPIAVALAVWYANRSAEYAPFDPYLVEHTAAGADPLFLTMAVVAACAAWEGGRLRRAGWINLPSARPSLIAVAPLLIPTLVAGLVAAAAGLEWKLHLGGVGFLPDLRFVPTLIAVVAALVILGFAIGTRVPTPIAAPAMLVGVYLWMAIPGAVIDPIWLRHLSGGELGSCCSLDSDIDIRGLIAPLVVAVGIASSAFALLIAHPQRSWLLIPMSVAPITLGLAAGAVLAHDLSRMPVAPRSPASLVCADSTPRVCVWPEHRSRLAEATAVASEVTAAWSRFGISPPAEFTEASLDMSSPDVRSFGIWTGADRTEIIQALALSMLPDWPACAESAGGDQMQPAYLGVDAYDYVLAWFEATAGIPRRVIRQEYRAAEGSGQPDVAELIERVRSLPPQQQQSWVENNLAALSACDIPPRLEPQA